MVEIKLITNKNDPALIPVIDWLYDWWGKEEGYSKVQVEAYVRNAVCIGRIPQLFIVFENHLPVGTFQFAMSDIDTRPDIYPWLRDVYLIPSCRKKGYFYLMMDVIKSHAKQLGLQELYLFTTHTALYEKFGWEFIEIFPTYLTPDDYQRLYRLQI